MCTDARSLSLSFPWSHSYTFKGQFSLFCHSRVLKILSEAIYCDDSLAVSWVFRKRSAIIRENWIIKELNFAVLNFLLLNSSTFIRRWLEDHSTSCVLPSSIYYVTNIYFTCILSQYLFDLQTTNTRLWTNLNYLDF